MINYLTRFKNKFNIFKDLPPSIEHKIAQDECEKLDYLPPAIANHILERLAKRLEQTDPKMARIVRQHKSCRDIGV